MCIPNDDEWNPKPNHPVDRQVNNWDFLRRNRHLNAFFTDRRTVSGALLHRLAETGKKFVRSGPQETARGSLMLPHHSRIGLLRDLFFHGVPQCSSMGPIL
jgi:hypothetical protein